MSEEDVKRQDAKSAKEGLDELQAAYRQLCQELHAKVKEIYPVGTLIRSYVNSARSRTVLERVVGYPHCPTNWSRLWVTRVHNGAFRWVSCEQDFEGSSNVIRIVERGMS